MEEKTARLKTPPIASTQWGKYVLLIISLLGIIVILVSVFNRNSLSSVGSLPTSPKQIISEETLESQYGIQINLIAVTAAGGLVDFRMKILDAEKARQLITGPSSQPALFIEEGGILLSPPEDRRDNELSLDDGGLVFDLFPNTQSIVQPGTSVTVVFGEIWVEPIVSK